MNKKIHFEIKIDHENTWQIWGINSFLSPMHLAFLFNKNLNLRFGLDPLTEEENRLIYKSDTIEENFLYLIQNKNQQQQTWLEKFPQFDYFLVQEMNENSMQKIIETIKTFAFIRFVFFIPIAKIKDKYKLELFLN